MTAMLCETARMPNAALIHKDHKCANPNKELQNARFCSKLLSKISCSDYFCLVTECFSSAMDRAHKHTVPGMCGGSANWFGEVVLVWLLCFRRQFDAARGPVLKVGEFVEMALCISHPLGCWAVFSVTRVYSVYSVASFTVVYSIYLQS